MPPKPVLDRTRQLGQVLSCPERSVLRTQASQNKQNAARTRPNKKVQKSKKSQEQRSSGGRRPFHYNSSGAVAFCSRAVQSCVILHESRLKTMAAHRMSADELRAYVVRWRNMQQSFQQQGMHGTYGIQGLQGMQGMQGMQGTQGMSGAQMQVPIQMLSGPQMQQQMVPSMQMLPMMNAMQMVNGMIGGMTPQQNRPAMTISWAVAPGVHVRADFEASGASCGASPAMLMGGMRGMSTPEVPGAYEAAGREAADVDTDDHQKTAGDEADYGAASGAAGSRAAGKKLVMCTDLSPRSSSLAVECRRS